MGPALHWTPVAPPQWAASRRWSAPLKHKCAYINIGIVIKRQPQRDYFTEKIKKSFVLSNTYTENKSNWQFINLMSFVFPFRCFDEQPTCNKKTCKSSLNNGLIQVYTCCNLTTRPSHQSKQVSSLTIDSPNNFIMTEAIMMKT